jgi:hypothetical protein
MTDLYLKGNDDYIIIYYKTDKYGQSLMDISDLNEADHMISKNNPDKKVYALPDAINIELTNKETLCETLEKILKQLKPNILITEVDDGR